MTSLIGNVCNWEKTLQWTVNSLDFFFEKREVVSTIVIGWVHRRVMWSFGRKSICVVIGERGWKEWLVSYVEIQKKIQGLYFISIFVILLFISLVQRSTVVIPYRLSSWLFQLWRLFSVVIVNISCRSRPCLENGKQNKKPLTPTVRSAFLSSVSDKKPTQRKMCFWKVYYISAGQTSPLQVQWEFYM